MLKKLDVRKTKKQRDPIRERMAGITCMDICAVMCILPATPETRIHDSNDQFEKMSQE